MTDTGRRSDADIPSTDRRPSVVPLALGGLAMMAVAMGLGRFAFTPLLPDLMAGLSLSPRDAGIIASANYVGYLAGAILAAMGWAAGRERAAFLLALVATTLLLAAMPLTTAVVGLSLIRFGAGVASAFAMIFCTAIVVGHFEAAGRSGLQALHFSGVGIGIAGSAVLVLWLHSVGVGWQVGWYAAAGLALAGTVVSVVLVRTGPVRVNGEVREPPLVWDRKLISITFAYGLFGFGYIVTATFLVAIIRGANGHLSLEGLVWLATGIAAAPSVLYWSPSVRRFGLILTFSIGCLVEAVGVGASVLLPVPAGPFIGGVLLGGTFVAVTAFGLQIGRKLSPQSPRRAIAIMTAAFGTGQIIGPAVAGTLADVSGNYTSGSLVALAALLISAACALLAKPGPPGTQL